MIEFFSLQTDQIKLEKRVSIKHKVRFCKGAFFTWSILALFQKRLTKDWFGI